jgi:hypothetical protein
MAAVDAELRELGQRASKGDLTLDRVTRLRQQLVADKENQAAVGYRL